MSSIGLGHGSKHFLSDAGEVTWGGGGGGCCLKCVCASEVYSSRELAKTERSLWILMENGIRKLTL